MELVISVNHRTEIDRERLIKELPSRVITQRKREIKRQPVKIPFFKGISSSLSIKFDPLC